jgi:hypothetical protein
MNYTYSLYLTAQALCLLSVLICLLSSQPSMSSMKRQGKTSVDTARHDRTGHDNTRHNTPTQDTTRQAKTKENKTKQDTTNRRLEQHMGSICLVFGHYSVMVF